MKRKSPFVYQKICAINSSGRKVTRKVRGRDNRELANAMILKLSNKKDRQFSAALSKGTGLCWPDERRFENQYIKKGAHAQLFLKNCDYEFTKWQHIDIMCMVKSGYKDSEIASNLCTSPQNLKTLKKQILKKLCVSHISEALRKLCQR